MQLCFFHTTSDSCCVFFGLNQGGGLRIRDIYYNTVFVMMLYQAVLLVFTDQCNSIGWCVRFQISFYCKTLSSKYVVTQTFSSVAFRVKSSILLYCILVLYYGTVLWYCIMVQYYGTVLWYSILYYSKSQSRTGSAHSLPASSIVASPQSFERSPAKSDNHQPASEVRPRTDRRKEG